ncbi:uncharacterized protein LOC130451476 [Diorhabda sublineata]|uniref:uncharacterized protein LOC130451476 n=1 Tax=Diorhabda sublineata TaxID=1163346 RepID=UPI0024E155B3|nr:uncharacterized protein LOC130451476 [Diorhabda sublineata]XP_056646486.1 uncharacterized protein LOC130451476 [Diorhabda sublineata]
MKLEILWLFTLHVFSCRAADVDCRREPKCVIARVHKMKTANCYDKQFKNFPKCLNTDVEIIDLSFNRIRKITKADIDRFKYLKFLYLADNLLTNIEIDVFEDADDLTTLDLSLNAINRVPPVIFQLPSLTSLYLSQNLNINIVDAIEVSKPIVSPLTQIDISQTTDEDNYSDFPNFGILPFLLFLNITRNFYFNLTPRFFMGLCNLQKLINDNVTTDFEDPCDCWRINYWLKDKHVKFSPFRCEIVESQCKYTDFKEEDLQLYNQCKEKHAAIQRSNLILKISIGIGVALITIIILIVIIYFWRKRKNNRIKHNSTIKKHGVDDSSPLNIQGKAVSNEYSL